MKSIILFLITLVPIICFAQDTTDFERRINELHWIQGPATGKIGEKATIFIPAGYQFLGEQDAKEFLKISGNIPEDGNYLLAPNSLSWWSVFRFSETGYIKDDEKIDANDLLNKLKSQDQDSNQQRKNMGLQLFYTDGWQLAPHYDSVNNRLEWAIRLRDENYHTNINYTTRLLGRSGVISAILVGDTDTLENDTREFKKILRNFNYVSGETYAEYKPGDHVAEIGLSALILGGAAAVAAKKGFFGIIAGFLAATWKFILGGIAALWAAIKRLFSRKE